MSSPFFPSELWKRPILLLAQRTLFGSTYYTLTGFHALHVTIRLSPDLAAGIARVKGVKRVGVRAGNWISAEQGKKLIATCPAEAVRGKRDRAILAVLLGCGLRRAELVDLNLDDLQVREEHWILADLVSKGGPIRTVHVPGWVKIAVDNWTSAAGIKSGRVFRAINKAGRVWGNGFTSKVIWKLVRKAAVSINLPNLAPHDLRRSCARLCHLAGGEIEQIQFLLGYVSLQTTERYLDCKQNLRKAVNDRIGLEPESN